MFTILSVLSLLLCLATLALWVRSYWRVDSVGYSKVSGVLWTWSSAESRAGRITLFQNSVHSDFVPAEFRGWQVFASTDYKTPLGPSTFFGFGTTADKLFYAQYGKGVYFPHWFLALLFAILPALYLRAFIRSRRVQRLGLCRLCGYDLRATPERCPECGAENATAETPRAQSPDEKTE